MGFSFNIVTSYLTKNQDAQMKNMFARLLIYQLFLLSSSIAYTQTYQLNALKAAINLLDADRDMQGAMWSLCVRDAETGKIIVDHFGNKTLPTASTMKVVTTATALAKLGGNYRFQTQLLLSGALNNGVLEGDLIIKGGGDPTLGSSRFGVEDGLKALMNNWTTKIQAAGIKKINGRIITDVRAYSTQTVPGFWSWEDLGNYYGAGIFGLNINDNEYRIDFVPASRVGAKAELIRTDPYIPGLTLTSEVTTGKVGSGDNAYIFGSPYTYSRYIRGTIPAGKKSFSIRGSLPDPPLFAAQHLRHALIECGISVEGEGLSSRNILPEDPAWKRKSSVIFTYESPPLSKIIVPLNIKSINMYAEALGALLTSPPTDKASISGGAKAMKDYWKSQGVITKGMLIDDGSGLSPTNAMTTKQLSEILSKVHRASYGKYLYASLPIAGRSGSLSYMLKNTRAEGNMRAKSGYISGTRSYAGYVDAKNGRRLSFSIVAYNYDCSPGSMRRKLEKVMAQIAEL